MAARPRVNKCPFCGRRSSLTREHVYPDWAVQELRDRGFRDYRVFFSNETVSTRWEQRTLADTVRIVCADCNSGWMSRLEADAAQLLKPMMFDNHPTELRGEQIALISRWALLRAFAIDMAHARQQSYFSSRERRDFRDRLSVPPGVQIWLGADDPQRAQVTYLVGRTTATMPDRERFSFSTTGYVLGHVVFQVNFARWSTLSVRRTQDPPVFTQDLDWNRFSVVLWPAAPVAVWPPAEYMDGPGLDRFLARTKNVYRRLGVPEWT